MKDGEMCHRQTVIGRRGLIKVNEAHKPNIHVVSYLREQLFGLGVLLTQSTSHAYGLRTLSWEHEADLIRYKFRAHGQGP
jgi:hypothetical protein